jgi:AcrR family transcriptional regulator
VSTAVSERPRRRLKPEQRRELILDSALQAFSELGYHAASVDAMARGAGTTKAVIYDHFASKRELYEAVVLRELRLAFEVMEAAARDASDFPERLRAFLRAFFAHNRDRPHASRIMLETVDAGPAVGDWQRRTQSRATAAIAAQLAEAGLLAGHPDRELALEMVAQMLKTALNGLVEWWHYYPDVPLDVVVDRATSFLMGALAGVSEGATPGKPGAA